MPRVIKVIESQECRGRGTEQDPSRLVTVYYTLEGEWLAQHDPHETNQLPLNSTEPGASDADK